MGRILCPVNFTEVARDALDYAAHLSAAFEAELVVVHIAETAKRQPADKLAASK